MREVFILERVTTLTDERSKVSGHCYMPKPVSINAQARLKFLEENEYIGVIVYEREIAEYPQGKFPLPLARLAVATFSHIAMLSLKEPKPSYLELANADIPTLLGFCETYDTA